MARSALLVRASLAATTAAALALTGLVTAPPGTAAGGTFTQTTGITINDAAAASPYPSNITVSGLPRGITDLNVTLSSLDHTFPDNVDVMLVGPTGQSVILMSDVGGGDDVSGVNLTLDDQAAASLPNSSLLTSGSFKPTDGNPSPDAFTAPAPNAALAANTMSAFNTTNPNGTWQLFVMDDAAPNTGDFSGGWSMQITTADVPAAPVFTAPAVSPSTDRDGDFILAGTAQVASTVKVFEGTTQVGSATATGGSWAVAVVDVPDGAHSYTATATDAFGNVSAASAARTVVVDSVHPRVVRTRPGAGADEVRRERNVRARFSEAMRPATLNARNVRLINTETGDTVRARRTYRPATHSVVINPRQDLAPDTRYKVVIRTAVKDVAGNRLDQRPARTGNQPKIFRFTTR
jgi:subtilisin-like proprotein convertase family protein